jgi:quinol monooxygenase YgiN
MVKHIVIWRLRDRGDTAARNKGARRIAELLESMRGKIPGLLKIEVGHNFLDDANAADLVLYSEFQTRAALDAYQNHPVHEAVKPEIRDLVTERRVVDYEV